MEGKYIVREQAANKCAQNDAVVSANNKKRRTK